jgi:hypothetical protein
MGYGVFCTSKIPKNTIVCSYLGDITTNEYCSFNYNSIFRIGYIRASTACK